MSRIQFKITQHTKEQKNMTNSQVKISSTDATPEMIQMLELLD